MKVRVLGPCSASSSVVAPAHGELQATAATSSPSLPALLRLAYVLLPDPVTIQARILSCLLRCCCLFVCLALRTQVWALRADNGDLRVALINKDDVGNCNMKLLIDDKRFCRTASISRLLPGDKGLKSKDITWQGQSYVGAGFTGKIQGSKVVQFIQPKQYPKTGRCGFEIPVRASSAALLIAKK
eukprot:GHRQ01014170.1.p1 GENE.GHRQ01014170.1~~GHRQ01014170.1.p1  ORF type:complete len:185 (-),score=28.84 GHRQ01014170.1:197-751(-)